ncbi:hypothetical protein ZHAS_00014320 [Anopheles sinensis]|uniref:Uncharacterized protein n=1 Tax=Anopheles sinensis TaxID=74873 RepID=A0A084W7Y4_ANOSI|nr:hypothetical protein ZHAS_00014320 [Anopheles sinensis]
MVKHDVSYRRPRSLIFTTTTPPTIERKSSPQAMAARQQACKHRATNASFPA